MHSDLKLNMVAAFVVAGFSVFDGLGRAVIDACHAVRAIIATLRTQFTSVVLFHGNAV